MSSPVNWKPKKYQEQAVQFLLEKGCAGLFLSPGLGKTSISLATYTILAREGLTSGALIVAPLRPCYLVWPKEITKWKEFSHLRIGILHGPDKGKVLKGKYDLYVINPEGLKWLVDELAKYGHRDWPFDTLIVDESSRFKHVHTQRFKNIKQLLPKFQRRYILTGTPAANHIENLFGQMFIVDRGATFGPYITHFRNKYFYRTGYGGYELAPKPTAEEDIYTAISPKILQMSDKDYLQLPPLVESTVSVELDKKSMEAYQQLETMLFLAFKEGRVTAANTGAASIKCRQLANGGLYLDGEDRKWKHVHYHKAEAVAELVEELEGQPALIAYEFHHDLERLQQTLKPVLGETPPYIGSGVSMKQTQELESLWNKGQLPVLLGQPQSMGHGLNMQEKGRAVIWASLLYDYELYDQLIRRVWRQGQTERVFLYHIIVESTIDEAVMKALQRKGKGQEALFKALKEYWQNRLPSVVNVL